MVMNTFFCACILMTCNLTIICLASLLLNTVSDEDTQARTDRVMLTPWVKFLWESYRNILELTKNNQTFEKLYADVAKEGMTYQCKQ